ncbi:MAG: diaminopimelate epimerase [Chloroflexi bacterium]|nr:diaminopimelate epimerase [Chloroflexota bacterium]
MHGAGNDFIVIEVGNKRKDWANLAKAMCDRHFGIGADGLVLVLPSNKSDFRMREFNPDGSEAEACGNGLRCLARYAQYKKLTKAGAREISLETLAGIRKARFFRAGEKEASIQIGMGQPAFEPKNIPVMIESGRKKLLDIKYPLNYSVTIDKRKLLLDFVSMGNPHAVYFGQQPVSDFPLEQLGPKIEHHKIFPKRTNFEVVRVISRRQIEARVWERGVGETLACGSGTCAIAVAAQLHGYVAKKVAIKLPGGVLSVEWDGSGEVFLSGPAQAVFTGDWLE